MISSNPLIQSALDHFNDFSFQDGGTATGLARMVHLMSALGNPENTFTKPIIHIAGTNGKGSTCAIIQSILHEAGLKTCCYTKPHLVNINERYQIHGQNISDNALLDAIKTIQQSHLTQDYFQALIAIMILCFLDHQEQTDVYIIEAGSGGRFDSTNIIPNTHVQIITGIDLDHQHILGSSLKSIAWHKAGIFKPHGKVIINSQIKQNLQAYFKQEAKNAGSQRFTVAKPVSLNTPIGISGQHQTALAGIAQEAVLSLYPSLPQKTIEQGLAKSRIPGRQQVLTDGAIASSRQAITMVDVASNPQAMKSLIHTLAQKHNRWQVVFASKQAPDVIKQNLAILAPIAESLVMTLVPGFTKRHLSESQLTQLTKASGLNINQAVSTHTLTQALKLIDPKKPLIITGSLYLVGEALKLNETTPTNF